MIGTLNHFWQKQICISKSVMQVFIIIRDRSKIQKYQMYINIPKFANLLNNLLIKECYESFWGGNDDHWSEKSYYDNIRFNLINVIGIVITIV